MNKFLMVTAAFALTAASALAVPACSTLIGQDVNPGGNTTSISCTVGPLTFSNFQYSLAGGSGTPTIDLSGVYGPSAGPEPPAGLFGLNFNPNLGGSTNPTDLHFTFEVTGPTLSAFLFNGGTANSQIQERICNSAGVSISGSCTGAQVGTDMVANGGQSQSITFAPQTAIFVWKDINITSATLDHMSSFDQAFGSPEPMTMSMMGLGLLGLGLIRRRFRS
jgi:hypothetical protein